MKSKDFQVIRSPRKHKSDYVPLSTVNKHKIVIKSHNSSPRLEYTLDFIFNHFFDNGYKLILNDEDKIHMDYAGIDNQDLIGINQSDYLFSDQILPPKNAIELASPDFDLFAFVFYQLSRAEEYNHVSKDSFGRFESSEANIKENFTKPIVDILLLELAKSIKDKFAIELIRRERFRLIHTVDVDQIFAYKHKNLKRSLGGTVSNVLKGKLDRLMDRSKTLMDGKDPYDSFEILKQGAKNAESHYFILVGNYDEIDNALEIEKPAITSKILELGKEATIGIHPSVKSNQNNDLLKQEINRLESIISTSVNHSRQHFLHLKFPETYRNLLEQAIKNDYSLAYHDRPGFRAGTTNSFYWFDLGKNHTTDLLLHPLIVMDVSMKKYQNLTSNEAKDLTKSLIDECKKVNGPFSLLWHNSSFYEEEGWAGWKETYVDITNYCQELTA